MAALKKTDLYIKGLKIAWDEICAKEDRPVYKRVKNSLG